MIQISYDANSQRAIIRALNTTSELAWADIRRVCEDRGQNATAITSHLIAVPWWSFLSLRPHLNYVLARHGIRPEFSEQARYYLTEARTRESAYRDPAPTIIDQVSLQHALAKVGFTRQITNEQARNILKMLQYPAAATFSVPGAGKTTEALAYFFLRRDPDTRLLVVAPKNAFAAWEEQLLECARGFGHSIVRLQGGELGVTAALDNDPVISLINYELVHRVVSPIAAYMVAHPTFMYLDESHRMKRGHDGVYGAALLSLAHLPACKLILSGTPLPNSVSDLVPQFTFLYPEITVDEQTVTDSIRKISVRTTKDELGLKRPHRRSRDVDMGPAQRRLYENLRSEAARQLSGLRAADKMRLRSFGKAIVHLMQVTTDPALLASSELAEHHLLRDAISEGPAPKIVEACRLARQLAREDRKCIIWAQFVRVVEDVAGMLQDLGAEYIHGAVETDDDEENIESREAKIRRFHDDRSCMVLVANPAACAEGISLHRVCHDAIYIDRNYNAAHYLQSEDRIHRLGLGPDEETYVTILHTPNSIDDSIQRRLQAKVERMGSVLNDPTLNIEPIRAEDQIDPISGLDLDDIEDIQRVLLGE